MSEMGAKLQSRKLSQTAAFGFHDLKAASLLSPTFLPFPMRQE
jgi:hypothetical protein